MNAEPEFVIVLKPKTRVNNMRAVRIDRPYTIGPPHDDDASHGRPSMVDDDNGSSDHYERCLLKDPSLSQIAR